MNIWPFFYYINLEKDTNRNQYILKHFQDYKVNNYLRVDGCDAIKENLQTHIDQNRLDVGPKDLAVTVSHLMAIKKFANSSNEYAIICEDDLDLSTSKYWNFTWEQFFSSLSHQWDIIQLTTSSPNIIFNLHLRKKNDWGTVAYLINKQYALFLVNKIFDNNNNIDYAKLNDWHRPSKRSKAMAEGIVYQSKNSYSIPLMVYNTDFESNVHQDHVGRVHIPAKEKIINYWKNYST